MRIATDTSAGQCITEFESVTLVSFGIKHGERKAIADTACRNR